MHMVDSLTTSAPGKIIIHGEHAVVYGKEALAACINKRVKCYVKKLNNSDSIHLKVLTGQKSIDWAFKKSFLMDLQESCTDAKIPSPLSAHNLEGLNKLMDVDKLEKIEVLLLYIWIGLYLSIASDYFIKRTEGLSMEIKSELVFGAGTGSSASLSVSMSAALLAICGFIKPKMHLSAQDNEMTTSFEENDLKLINGWAYEAEKIVHGKPSGVDNSVITYGGALSYKNGEISFLNSFPSVNILLVNSGVSRSTMDLVAGVKRRHQELPEVYEAIFDAIGKLTEKAKLNFMELDKALKDNKNAMEVDIIYERIINLIDINQNLLKAIGVSHESIEAILDILKKYEFKGKLTGAGGGGCVFSIIKPATNVSVTTDVIEDLKKSGFECWMVQLGGKGVTIEQAADY